MTNVLKMFVLYIRKREWGKNFAHSLEDKTVVVTRGRSSYTRMRLSLAPACSCHSNYVFHLLFLQQTNIICQAAMVTPWEYFFLLFHFIFGSILILATLKRTHWPGWKRNEEIYNLSGCTFYCFLSEKYKQFYKIQSSVLVSVQSKRKMYTQNYDKSKFIRYE